MAGPRGRYSSRVIGEKRGGPEADSREFEFAMEIPGFFSSFESFPIFRRFFSFFIIFRISHVCLLSFRARFRTFIFCFFFKCVRYVCQIISCSGGGDGGRRANCRPSPGGRRPPPLFLRGRAGHVKMKINWRKKKVFLLRDIICGTSRES